MKLISVFIFFLVTQNVAASPLFEESSDQPLVVVIETDLHKIKNKKSDYHTSTENYINGRFQIRDEAFDIKLQTRGHDRLASCPFPPLRIFFDKSKVKKSLLKHNHNLKMVTHCQEDVLHLLFQEYSIYKIYNLITPYSFQVRLLKVQYIDINRKEDAIETYAFFIESPKSIEKRLELVELESDQDFNMKTYTDISEYWLSVSQTKLQDAFQHLIRNSDWVIFYTDATRTFLLANIKFFSNGKEGFPFPYDFDLAGMVTGHTENYQFRYGNEFLCENVEMKRALMKILSHKDEYLELLDNDSLLSIDYKRKFTEYLDKFETVDDFCSEMDLVELALNQDK